MLTLENLERYQEEGWLIKQTHPNLPLTIWNYSQQTQYEGKWDEITLQCRGLVTMDETGDIVARPFKKFFNIEEGKHTPTEKYDVYMKMDGSLIICFYYQGSWILASRGSFTSDQARAASKLFYKEYGSDGMNMDTTYLFEFTAPWNRIVVDYGDREELTLLGGIRTEDGVESPWWHLDNVSQLNGISLVQKYDSIEDYTKLKELIFPDEEGYVIRFSNGDRMKIKGEEYIRLHRIMTQISTTSIWDSLKNGEDIYKLIEDVPDEFYDKISNYVETTLDQYWEISKQSEFYFHEYFIEGMNGKEFNENISHLDNIYKSLLFCQFNMKMNHYSELIWSYIRPTYKAL
jgi:T4 RnlA family RNA ligase